MSSPRTTLVALLLACATLITLDFHGGTDSALEPVRRGVGEAFGPAERVSAAAFRPVQAIPEWFSSKRDLRDDVATLTAENADLKEQLNTRGYNKNRLAEYDGLTRTSKDLGRALVPARVIAYGPQQSFSRTVTIDAGSDAGLRPDLTVVNADGLVGRVLRTTSDTATVLLILDQDSTVGARIGDNMEVGFLKGRGVIGAEGRLDLELIDSSVTPAKGEQVVTWGSNASGPYLPGVPIGTVTQVFTTVRDSSLRAVIEPHVDFSSLDLVGVVVPSGIKSDRSVIEADGEWR